MDFYNYKIQCPSTSLYSILRHTWQPYYLYVALITELAGFNELCVIITQKIITNYTVEGRCTYTYNNSPSPRHCFLWLLNRAAWLFFQYLTTLDDDFENYWKITIFITSGFDPFESHVLLRVYYLIRFNFKWDFKRSIRESPLRMK